MPDTENPYKQMLAARSGSKKAAKVQLAEQHHLAEEVASHLGLGGNSSGASLPSIGGAPAPVKHHQHFLAAEMEHKSRLKNQRRASNAVMMAAKRRNSARPPIPASPIQRAGGGIRAGMAATHCE